MIMPAICIDMSSSGRLDTSAPPCSALTDSTLGTMMGKRHSLPLLPGRVTELGVLHRCSSGYDLRQYPASMSVSQDVSLGELNTQVAEQVNALLECVRTQVW